MRAPLDSIYPGPTRARQKSTPDNTHNGRDTANHQQVVTTFFASRSSGPAHQPIQGVEPPDHEESELEGVHPKVAAAEMSQFVPQDRLEFPARQQGVRVSLPVLPQSPQRGLPWEGDSGLLGVSLLTTVCSFGSLARACKSK